MVSKWLRKWFDMVTAGDAPADVDAAAHRSALWTAYITSSMLFTVCFILNLSLSIYLLFVLAPTITGIDNSWFNALAYFQRSLELGQPSIALAFFIPFLVYAFALLRKGYCLPLSIVNLIAAVLGAYVIAHILPHRLWNTGWEYLLLAAALIFQRQLTSSRARKIAFWSILWLVVIYAANSLANGWMANNLMFAEHPLISFDTAFIIIGWVALLLILPVMILFPIGMMAAPSPGLVLTPASQTRPIRIFGAILTLGLVLAAVYATVKYLEATSPISMSWIYTRVIDHASYSIWIILLGLYLAAYFSRIASPKILAFLIVTPVSILTLQRLVEFSQWPGERLLGLILLISGIAALALSAEGRFRAGKLRAAGIIMLGSLLVWLYCWLVLPHIVEQLKATMLTPASSPIAIAFVARAVLLIFISALLLFAWWFISPKEIESLVLGKQAPASEQFVNDGTPTP